MLLNSTDAAKIALEFLMSEWSIPEKYQEWFTIFSSRLLGVSWYIVELGLEGLPDRWYFQVYDTGECDPNYTFNSPLPATENNTDLETLPELIAQMLAAERNMR